MVKNVPTTKKENNAGRNALSVVIIVFFIGGTIANYISNDFEIPFGLEIGFLTVCGYVFGSTFTSTLKEFINNKRKK